MPRSQRTQSTTRPSRARRARILGRWNHLVSTTNWEKGRIICQWREALLAAGAAAASCTDEAWSRRVGNLTPQHCGRLRRVWQRFGEARDQYPGLYWSHFQAALEWSDAEMWLEGAVQNGWSIAKMSNERSATLDGLEAGRRPPTELPAEPGMTMPTVGREPAAGGDLLVARRGPRRGRRRGDDADAERHDRRGWLLDATGWTPSNPREPVRPFEGLPPLPADLGDALEAFKLAIVHHRQAGWKDISCRAGAGGAGRPAAVRTLARRAIIP